MAKRLMKYPLEGISPSSEDCQWSPQQENLWGTHESISEERMTFGCRYQCPSNYTKHKRHDWHWCPLCACPLMWLLPWKSQTHLRRRRKCRTGKGYSFSAVALEPIWPKLGMRQSFRWDKKCHETGLSILTIQRQGWNLKARKWCDFPAAPDPVQLSHKFWPTNWEDVCYLHGPEEDDKTRNRQRFAPDFTDAESQNRSSVPKSICLQRSHSNYPASYLQQSEY